MRKYYLVMLIAISLFFQSCINLKPFKVGDNIDNDWKINNLTVIKKELNNIADYICYNNIAMKNIAIGYFIGIDSDDRYEGKLLAYDLQDSLLAKCGLKTYLLNTYQYIDGKNYLKLTKKPDKKYEFLIYGVYRYRNKGYDLSTVIYDLQKLKIIDIIRGRIMIHTTEIEINTLHIPREIELK